MKNKRGMSIWIWILIILILIVAGVVVYSLVTGNNISNIIGGSSVPTPPALPD